ncbi:glycosyltransferase family 2 protein [Morganella morganii]|uniref:Glycosyltransferase family 2 protein n=1 Tax=Morganella morganii TaxID=582 RepID=A0AAE4JRW5_MORMO|nr:glycosyltransferase family 2 protein [Morganella morganii]MDS0900463.1 glycosyltransferase family 2 protein [Morganella morganii]QXO77582.1 glycosyltransferase family 2 protein [Morganella morganii]
MYNPIVSVIVPVYGVEKYIERCLKSIQKQTFRNFECIVVDDGSLDNSIEIGRKAVEGDNRFIFFCKQNGGLASARNFGLDRANGEFITFVDSDDYVSVDFLEKPYRLLNEKNADICIFSAQCVDENYENIKLLSSSYAHNKDDVLLSSGDILSLLAWSKMYKKSSIEDVRFDESIITYEDVTYAIQVMHKKKLVFLKEALYFYLQRVGSLSKDIKPTYLEDRLAIINFCEKFYVEKVGKKNNDDYFVYTYLKFLVFHAISKFAFYSGDYSFDIKRLNKILVKDRVTFRNIIMVIKRDKRSGLSLLFFKLSPWLFRIVARIYYKMR